MQLNKALVKELDNILGEKSGQGMLYLLSLYFKLKNNVFELEVMTTVNRQGYVEKDHSSGNIIFKIPLFEGEEISNNWEWIEEFRQLFNSKNKARKGSKQAVISRMKKFFSDNPDVRKEEVLGATLMYLRSVEPTYCKTAHKFIYEGKGIMKSSDLSEWVEKYKETQERNKTIHNRNKLL